MRFKMDWASLTVGSKFTISALSFLHYWFGGLIFGGAYTWIGSFSEFYGSFLRSLDRSLMYTAEVGVKRRFNVPSYS